MGQAEPQRRNKLLQISKLPLSNAQLLLRCSQDQSHAARRSLGGFALQAELLPAPLKAADAGETPRCMSSVILLASSLYLSKECCWLASIMFDIITALAGVPWSHIPDDFSD